MDIFARKSKIKIMLWCLFYIIIFDWAYINVISTLYSYAHYEYNEPQFIYLISAYIFALIPTLWLPYNIQRSSQILYWILYIFTYIPITIIPFYVIQDIEQHKIFINVLCVCIGFYTISLIYKIPLIKFPEINSIKYMHVMVVLFVITLGFYSYLISKFGLQLQFVHLDEVYDIRGEYKSNLEQFGSLVAYLVSWQGNIVNVLLFSYGIVKRKWICVLIGIIGQYMIYAITGFKGIFFSVFFLLILFLLLRHRQKYFIKNTIVATILACFLSIIIYYLLYDSLFSWAISLFLRRRIATIGLLSGLYFEYFSTNPHALLGHSIFSNFVDYPYDVGIAQVIGKNYFSETTNANANLWADGFANFGNIGIIVFSIILAVILWIYDSVTRNKNVNISCLLIGFLALSISNTSVLTWTLTGGVWLAIVLMYLMPKDYS